MIKLVVFDFDGTLADTKKMLLKIISANIEKFDYKIDKKFLKEFGNRPLDESLVKLGIREKVLPKLASMINIDFVIHAKEVKMNRGIKELNKIKQKKIVLSNSISEFIRLSLDKNKLRFFEEIVGSESFNHKTDGFKLILKRYKVKPSEVLYVGDRVIDVHVARKIGCKVVIISNKVSWSSREELIKADPDYLVKSLADIKKIVDLH